MAPLKKNCVWTGCNMGCKLRFSPHRCLSTNVSVASRVGSAAFYLTLSSLLLSPLPAEPPPEKRATEAFPHCSNDFWVAWTRFIINSPVSNSCLHSLSLHRLLNVKPLHWKSTLHLALLVLRIIFAWHYLLSHPTSTSCLTRQRQIWKEQQINSKYYLVWAN